MEKEESLKNYEKAIDYFMILGLKTEHTTGNLTHSELKNMQPEVLSVYPEFNEKEEFNVFHLVKEKIKLQAIFPNKANYMYNLNTLNLEVKKGCYEDYIIYSSDRPKEFYHCFSSKFCPDPNGSLYTWHFGVLIFYEQICVKSLQIEGGKNYYAAKAILFCSKKAYYVLYKRILEEVYTRYLDSIEQPIELMLINFYHRLSFEKNKPYLVKFFEFEYFIQGESFLPDYDLNLFAFFNKFSLVQFLIMAEQFLKRMPIIIFSNNISNLYPTYFTFMNLINPLDITNLNDYYILLSPDVIQKALSPYATFVAVNSPIISDDTLIQIVKEKQFSTLVINLDNFEMRMFEADTSTVIKINDSYNKSIIDYIFNNHITDNDLLSLIVNDIKLLTRYINESRDYNNITNYFCYLHPNKNKLEHSLASKIRKQFFSLFSKLLTFNIPFTEMSIKNKDFEENQNMPKNQIEIDFKEELEDPEIKSFYGFFKTTPSFNIVFKYKCKSYDSNLINLILLDELIKILKNDKNRLYFDQCLSICEAIPDNIEKIIFDEKHLFLDVGDYHNGLHVYNVNLLRNKITDYKLDDLGGDKYLIKYKFLKLYFNNFTFFLKKNKLSNKLKHLHSLTYQDSEINVLIYEIKAFFHLIKTGTLYIENLEHIITATLIVLLAIEIFSTGKDKEKKFDIIYELFNKTEGLENKFSFISSLIYEIIYKDTNLRDKYEYDFLMKLKTLKIIPTFNIFIKANDENKEKQKGPPVKLQNFPNMDFKLISNTLKCINHCSKANEKDMIAFSNMFSLKCSVCNEQSYLDLISTYDLYGTFDIKLKHPIQILLNLLNEIIQRESLEFNRNTLESMIDSITREDFRLLLFFIKIFNIEINTSILFDN